MDFKIRGNFSVRNSFDYGKDYKVGLYHKNSFANITTYASQHMMFLEDINLRDH